MVYMGEKCHSATLPIIRRKFTVFMCHTCATHTIDYQNERIDF